MSICIIFQNNADALKERKEIYIYHTNVIQKIINKNY